MLCEICGKKLTNPASIAKRIGPECEAAASQAAGFVSSANFSTEESSAPAVARWIELTKRALYARNRSDAERFLSRAKREASFLNS